MKRFVKDFYERKNKMSEQLLQTLDALQNERPAMMKLKRRHLEPEANQGQRETLEIMRLNAERDRIDKYKFIALNETKRYYALLDHLSLVNEGMRNPEKPTTKSSQSLSVHAGKDKEIDFQEMILAKENE